MNIYKYELIDHNRVMLKIKLVDSWPDRNMLVEHMQP